MAALVAACCAAALSRAHGRSDGPRRVGCCSRVERGRDLAGTDLPVGQRGCHTHKAGVEPYHLLVCCLHSSAQRELRSLARSIDLHAPINDVHEQQARQEAHSACVIKQRPQRGSHAACGRAAAAHRSSGRMTHSGSACSLEVQPVSQYYAHRTRDSVRRAYRST